MEINNRRLIGLGIAIGLFISALAFSLFLILQMQTSQPQNTQQQPLYWVAPMDDNFRRDKPGKSPMGMDLVPVYSDKDDFSHDSATEKAKGVVTIAPHVINNMGVRVETVEEKSIASQIRAVGSIKFDQDKLVHIHPRVEGWIEKLFVNSVGDPVNQGQALYTLYSPQLVNAQEELLIALKRANNSLINAAKERLLALQLPISYIQELEKTRKAKQTITFYAPQSGVIETLNIREGFYVEPGNTLMSIGQLQQVWVEANVFERDAAFVKSGLAVTMTLDYLPSKLWKGRVDYVYPTLDSATRTLKLRLKFDNSELLLKPNMFTNIVIHGADTSPAIWISKQAIIRTGDHNRVVLGLGKGRFKSIEVLIGRETKHVVEVLKGLDVGDEVVISAQFLIDSESAKTSDFIRMGDQNTLAAPAKNVNTASVTGLINAIDVTNRVVNISRGPIAKWDRPAARMDFQLAKDIDIKILETGMQVHFTFVVNEQFTIVKIHPIEQANRSNHSVELQQ